MEKRDIPKGEALPDGRRAFSEEELRELLVLAAGAVVENMIRGFVSLIETRTDAGLPPTVIVRDLLREFLNIIVYIHNKHPDDISDWMFIQEINLN